MWAQEQVVHRCCCRMAVLSFICYPFYPFTLFYPSGMTTFLCQRGARVEDLVEEGIRSELSDIAEEPEEDMMHPDHRGRKSQSHARDNKSPRDSRSPREYDRKGDRSDHRDDRHDRRDKRYDDRRDDRRDREYRDDRYDDRMDDRSRRDDKRDGRMDDRRDRYGPRDSDIPRTKHSQSHSDSRSHERHHGRSSPTNVHRDSRGRSYNSRAPDPRRLNNLDVERRNSAGQVIIEPEENLSDKEIYPQSQHVIPAIEITRDSELGSHDEYMRSGRRGQYPDSHKTPPSTTPAITVAPTKPPPQSTGIPGEKRTTTTDTGGHSRSSRDNYHGSGDGEYRSRSNYRGEKSRMFIAVYPYDPLTMSPNPSTAHEELSFHEGQIIKVYGEKDSDGYFYGEINGRVGYVPYKMVSELPMDEEEANRHLMNETVPPRHHHSGAPGDPWSNYPVKKLVALYDYDPQELSPNVDAEMELAFRTGDVIYVYGEADEDGFYMGELNGERGLVPSNFLTEAPPDFRDPRIAQSNRSGGGGGNYPKESRDSGQYQRGSGSTHYQSSRPSKEHMPSDKTRYSERSSTERSYDRSRDHTSERDRGQYNSSSRSGQHW
ncbi:RIMS-binding protein 2 [Caerostris extrusa]|uniref:RIMS-binding protein 2 n=1 Tax=Caerostris extrusa TaxID=172846 RepID=A0AAV4S0B9_CAEEX|nr:RIMS-binding protein 2 [Caerostris extrusa]